INVVSARPGEEVEGEVEATVGRFNRTDFRGTINAPLSDRLSTRVSDMSRDMEGYGERIVTGEKMGGKNQAAIKAAVRWIATDNFEINLAADYTHADEES